MKIRHFSSLLLFSLFALAACTDKKPAANEADAFALPVFEFQQQDSIDISSLATQYIDLYNAGNLDGAADMLYTVHGGEVQPLTDEQRQGYKTALSVLPNFGAKVKDLELLSDRDNRLCLLLKVAEDGDYDSERGTIRFMLNPILVEGKWYLSLMDEYAEGVGLYHQQ